MTNSLFTIELVASYEQERRLEKAHAFRLRLAATKVARADRKQKFIALISLSALHPKNLKKLRRSAEDFLCEL